MIIYDPKTNPSETIIKIAVEAIKAIIRIASGEDQQDEQNNDSQK